MEPELGAAGQQAAAHLAADTARPSTATLNNIADTLNQTVTKQSDIDVFYFYIPLQFAVMWVLFIAIVVGNCAVIVALLSTSARKSRMNYFIVQLAIADLFVGILYVFVDIIQKMTIAWLAGEFMCKLIKFLQAVVMYASTYVMVALSIDRCDAITNPMNFSGSWKRARLLVGSAWLISSVFSIPVFVLYHVTVIQGQVQCWIDLGSQQRWQVWMTLVSVVLFVIPALVITACYTIIVHTIWTKNKSVIASPPAKRIKSLKNGHLELDPDSRRASSRGLIPRAKIKSVKMTFVIVFVFVLCWSPYIVFDLAQVFELVPRTQAVLAAATLVQSLAPLNSAANPLICCLFSPHICTTLKRVVCRWRRQGGVGGRAGTGSRSRSESTAHSDLLSCSHPKPTHYAATILNSSSSIRASDRRKTKFRE